MRQEVLEHYDSIAGKFTDLSNKYCNSRYRTELERIVKEKDSVLEVGCGTGLMLSKLKAKNKIGCDFSFRLLSQLKQRKFLAVQADAERLPFGDSVFDVVYTINLLEHVASPEMAVSEMGRVLKKGGRLVIITPNGDWGLLLEAADALGLKAPEGPHHFLTTRKLRKILKRSNLGVMTSKKIVVVPSGPGFLKKIGEKIEQKTGMLGFFHLVIAEKI